jgi:hypothetical protein
VLQFQIIFRYVFIPVYYADHLLAKLDKLKQSSRTYNKYYHDFKICVLFGGLTACKKDVMARFMKWLNFEIQTMLIHDTYGHIHINHLFLLAQNFENQILFSRNTCNNNVNHGYSISFIPHANQEHKIMECTADFPLSQGELIANPGDKEELCDISSFTVSPQLDRKRHFGLFFCA